jgi:hypothetical protein
MSRENPKQVAKVHSEKPLSTYHWKLQLQNRNMYRLALNIIDIYGAISYVVVKLLS